MMGMPNLWAGLNVAPTFEGGTYLGPGVFDVQVDRCLLKQTQKSGIGFIAELTVLESSNPDHPVGVQRGWFQKMNTAPSLPAVKAFLLAVLGIDTDDAAKVADVSGKLETLMPRIAGAENILAGWRVHVQCTMIKTGKGGDFTRHDWEPYNYAQRQLQAPDLAAFLNAYGAAPQGYAPQGYGAPPPQAPPYGAPPPAQGWGAPPPMPPNTWGNPAPGAPPAGQVWTPPAFAPVAPPPPMAPPPAYPPGAQLSPDGRYYLNAATNSWVLIPGR